MRSSPIVFDLVIQGGTLITASEQFEADLAFLDGKIAAIGTQLRGHETVDARGQLVLPGAVDVHVHLEMPVGATVSSDDWQRGTVAAAHGGTTTVVDFVEPEPEESLLEAYQKRRRQAEGRAAIDFGLHMTLLRADAETLSQVSDVSAEGLTSFKLYTTYEGLCLNDMEMLAALRAIRDVDGLAIVHAENDALIQWFTQEFTQAGLTSPRYHPRSRPGPAEGEAIERVLALAEAVSATLYVVHVSTARGSAAVARARARGQLAFGETCPQYLLLSDEVYERPDFEGAKFVCSPPLRTPDDNRALWLALGAGGLQTVATDHCPFNFAGQKDLGRGSFVEIPGGLPGLEARLALLHTFGVCQGHLSLSRWVDVCCTTPARLFGLYPRKGTLLPGSDGDVVIFDPEYKLTLSQSTLHENVDYTPYAGMELCGYPRTTIARGETLVQEGRYVGSPGGGRFLRRGQPNLQRGGAYA